MQACRILYVFLCTGFCRSYYISEMCACCWVWLQLIFSLPYNILIYKGAAGYFSILPSMHILFVSGVGLLQARLFLTFWACSWIHTQIRVLKSKSCSINGSGNHISGAQPVCSLNEKDENAAPRCLTVRADIVSWGVCSHYTHVHTCVCVCAWMCLCAY